MNAIIWITVVIYHIFVSFKNFCIKTPEDGVTPKHNISNIRLYFYGLKVHSLVLGMNNCTKASWLGMGFVHPWCKDVPLYKHWIINTYVYFYSFWSWSLIVADDDIRTYMSQIYTYMCWCASDLLCASGLNTYFLEIHDSESYKFMFKHPSSEEWKHSWNTL